MSVNVELLQRVLEHIEAHPEEWDQTVYAKRTDCGTACCVAGHAVAMTGHKLLWETHALSGEVHVAYVEMPSGLRDHIYDAAAEALGLGINDSFDLFEPLNTLDDLWRVAARVTDGAVSRPVTT